MTPPRDAIVLSAPGAVSPPHRDAAAARATAPPRPAPGARARWLPLLLQVVVVVSILVAGAVIFHGDTKREIAFGWRLRLTDPTNPFLLIVACQGALAWLRARSRPWRVRARQTLGAVGWAALAILLVTLPVDRTLHRKNPTGWRQILLATSAVAFVVSRHPRLRGSGRTAPDPSSVSRASADPADPAPPAASTPGGACRLLHLDVGTVLFLGCAGWMLIAALASPFRPGPVGDWASGWLMALGMFWAIRLAWSGEAAARAVSRWLAVALGATVLVGGLQTVFGHSAFDLASGMPSGLRDRLASARATGMSLHPNYLGGLAAGLTLFALARGVRMERRGRAAVFYGLSVLGFALVLLTRSRGSLLGAVCGAMGIALAGSGRRWAVPFLLGLAMLAFSTLGAYGWRISELPSIVGREEGLTDLVGWRPVLWSAALDRMVERPVLGWGTGTAVFERLFDQSHPVRPLWLEGHHAHNLFLQIGVESGFTGAGVFAMLLFGGAWRAWRTRRTRGPTGQALTSGAFAVLLVFLVHGLVDVPFNRGGWLVLGLVLGLLNGGDSPRVGSGEADPSRSRIPPRPCVALQR